MDSCCDPCAKQVFVQEGIGAHQLVMTESKGNIGHQNALLRAVSLKKFDEVGSIESRAVDRVLAGVTGGDA